MKRILKWLAMQFGPTRRFLEERDELREYFRELDSWIRAQLGDRDRSSLIIDRPDADCGPGTEEEEAHATSPAGEGAIPNDAQTPPRIGTEDAPFAESFSRPVIICGPPRSGTTFVSSLVNSDASFEILNEFHLRRLPAVRLLMYDISRIATKAAWRHIDHRELVDRKASLMWQLWRSISSPSAYRKSATVHAQQFGMKTPTAEVDHPFYEEVFQHHPPKYVYCVRHPAKVLQSVFRLKGWERESLDDLKRFFSESWSAFSQMMEQFPERVFVFQIDRVGETKSDRMDVARRLFEFLDADFAGSSRRFTSNWAIVNAGSKKNRRTMDRSQIEEFLTSPEVAPFCEHFGYTLEELDIN